MSLKIGTHGYMGKSGYEMQKIQGLRGEKGVQKMRCHYSQIVCG